MSDDEAAHTVSTRYFIPNLCALAPFMNVPGTYYVAAVLGSWRSDVVTTMLEGQP